jgi:hypothetical protein
MLKNVLTGVGGSQNGRDAIPCYREDKRASRG